MANILTSTGQRSNRKAYKTQTLQRRVEHPGKSKCVYQNQFRKDSCQPPPQSDPRPHRIHLLSRHGSHPRGQRTGFQKQVLSHYCRRGHSSRRCRGHASNPGGRFNGLGLYVLKGKLIFYYNLVGVERTAIEGKNALTPGKHSIDLYFKYDGGGIGKGGLVTLSVDGQKVAEHQLTRSIPFRVSAVRPSTSGKIRGLRSAKTATCHSNLPVRSTKLWSN